MALRQVLSSSQYWPPLTQSQIQVSCRTALIHLLREHPLNSNASMMQQTSSTVVLRQSYSNRGRETSVAPLRVDHRWSNPSAPVAHQHVSDTDFRLELGQLTVLNRAAPQVHRCRQPCPTSSTTNNQDVHITDAQKKTTSLNGPERDKTKVVGATGLEPGTSTV